MTFFICSGVVAGLRSGQSLENEYFFKSQESLATVIDNDEDGDDDEDDVVAAVTADEPIPSSSSTDAKMSHSSSL